MKKCLIALLTLLTVFALASCDGTEPSVTDESESTVDTTPAETEPAVVKLSEDELRQIAVKYMQDSSQVVWRAKSDIDFSKDTGFTSQTTYKANKTYRGVLYSPGRTSTHRFVASLNAEGFYVGGTTWGTASGTTCSTSIYASWYQIANSFTARDTQSMLPSSGTGILPVGEYQWDALKTYTGDITQASGRETMFAAYAKLKPGDAIVAAWPKDGNKGHTRMVVEAPNILQTMGGAISGGKSYVTTTEQSSGFWVEGREYSTTWRVNHKYSFEELFSTYYVPVTIEELATGRYDEPEITLKNGNNARNTLAGLKGEITSNYYLNVVNVTITDENGQVRLEKKYYPEGFSCDIAYSANEAKFPEYEKGTYHYTLTACIGLGDVVLLDYEFIKD